MENMLKTLKLKKILYPIFGLATYLPGFGKLMILTGRMNRSRYFVTGTNAANNARYCYSVYLRHLVMAKQNGLPTSPKHIAELGPGESIGIGLAALLAGAEKYSAFDVIEHADLKPNIEVFDELVELFKKKEPIPSSVEFQDVKPPLESYEFPSDIITDELLKDSLDPQRLEIIRESISNCKSENSMINYVAPWYSETIVKKESIDMIISQAVMEHVVNLSQTYEILFEWIKPSGFMSHQIDFKCHGTSEEWNGHWTYSDFVWKLIQGNRPYLLNRKPHSVHINLLEENGWEVICDKIFKLPSKVSKNKLAKEFKDLSNDDLTISGAFIQSKKLTLHSHKIGSIISSFDTA